MHYVILASHTPSCRGFGLQWQCTNTYSELRGCLLVVWRDEGELISADVVYDSVLCWGDWVIVGWCLTHSFRKRRGRKLAPKILQGESFRCLNIPESSGKPGKMKNSILIEDFPTIPYFTKINQSKNPPNTYYDTLSFVYELHTIDRLPEQPHEDSSCWYSQTPLLEIKTKRTHQTRRGNYYA